jgi:hypothetical protein
MIAKAIAMKVAEKSHFSKLVAYITDAQDTSFRIGQVSVTNCYSDGHNDAIYEVLNTQMQNRRATSDKTYHLIVSFRAGEDVSPETLQAIEAELCTGLGFKEHQRISAVHQDTENLHIHIAINKVHPVKHTLHTPFRDYKTLAKLCAHLEQQYGLEIDNHSSQINHTAGRARDMERHSGVESLISWIQQKALGSIKQANTWAELHVALYENGLSIKPRGNGLALSTQDGSIGVKASSVARELSKGKLEQRLGAFETANEQSLSTIPVKQRYDRAAIITNPVKAEQTRQSEQLKKPPKISSTDLYNLYQTERLDSTVIRIEALQRARTQYQADIQQAKDKAAGKRRWLKALIQPGINKKLLLALTGKSLQADIKRINADYRQQRQSLYAQHRRFTWLDWLQQQATQGNPNALQILRQRQSNIDVKGNYLVGIKTPSEHFAPQQSKAKVTKKGTVFYLNNKAVIKDDGNRFHVAADADQAVLTSVLIYAKNRHGYQLSIRGNELFQENVVRASVKAGLNISFEQDHLEQRRVKLSAEMLLFGDGAVKNLTAQQSMGRRR